MRRRLAGALVLAAACSPTPPPEAGPAPDAGWLSGHVGLVRTGPQATTVQLVPDSGGAVLVTGPAEAEVRRLAGARVAVHGRREGRGFVADDYRVESVDGRPAVLGVVERGPGGGVQLRQADGTVLQLGGASAQLQPGQKVWVQGIPTLTVQSYGIVRP